MLLGAFNSSMCYLYSAKPIKIAALGTFHVYSHHLYEMAEGASHSEKPPQQFEAHIEGSNLF